MVVRVREGIVTCKTLAKDCGSGKRTRYCVSMRGLLSPSEAAELQDFDESMIHGQAFDAREALQDVMIRCKVPLGRTGSVERRHWGAAA